MSDEEKVKCPKCQSTQVHAEKRGWSLTTGMIGAGKIVLTCLNCGHKYKPGVGARP
jgi:predicted nucleic-acid-binding Zn-ribbon protein